jgi:primosomal protein N' (replication factor Y)
LSAAPTLYVEVAVPVPLRRTFTYAVPAELGPVAVGARVAVPFAGRKLAGIVVRVDVEDPSGSFQAKPIAGLLEKDPLFPAELLAFLEEAARYYFHPVGEVLRAAAPALPAGALKNLRTSGFLEAAEVLPGRSVGSRRELWVARTEVPVTGRPLGDRQRALLTRIEAEGRVAWKALALEVGAPRATLRALESRGLVATEEVDAPSDPLFGAPVDHDPPKALNSEQARAVEAITESLRAREAGAFLLHGVTGSGKTEVYLRVVEEALALGRGGLVLVPEIALTPQLVGRIRGRFGDAIAVLHSGLKDRERDLAWWALRRGSVRVAVGTRSALFAPIADLGVLVVDEEHDPSFKQEEGFRYHARDMALLRAHRAGAVCVLGSATPSLETYHRAERAQITLLEMNARATRQALPKVEVVDLRRHPVGPTGHPLISGPLFRALEQCLARKEQAILFLNRRGFAPSLRCVSCGVLAECPSCSVALTHHRRAALLRCHYCDYACPEDARCRECGSGPLEPLGVGTERLEDHLIEALAPARVARLDRDTATAATVDEVLGKLRSGAVDVLVGTQMVTKGHDIPNVTLVGVVLADQSLAFPDFRAAERTFQLLAQVAGRAGRGEAAGSVVVQSFQPQHAAVRRAAAHDFRGFYELEIRDRRELGYAPFGHLAAFRISAATESVAARAADALARAARSQSLVRSGAVGLLGPAPAPIRRVRNRYRFRLMLRAAERRPLRAVVAALVAVVDRGLGPVQIQLDVDPVQMM